MSQRCEGQWAGLETVYVKILFLKKKPKKRTQAVGFSSPTSSSSLSSTHPAQTSPVRTIPYIYSPAALTSDVANHQQQKRRICEVSGGVVEFISSKPHLSILQISALCITAHLHTNTTTGLLQIEDYLNPSRVSVTHTSYLKTKHFSDYKAISQ